MVESLQKTI